MKYPVFASLPAWHVWSDGRRFTPGEMKKFRKMWKSCRNPGECPRHFFLRARALVEIEMARMTAST